MSKVLLKNCGRIVSGDAESPYVDADTLLIENGRIAQIGSGSWYDENTLIVDIAGKIIVPGLIDSHSHPVIGDFTPRQSALGWVERAVHGGVTSLISAGETHWPGRSKDGIEAAAICQAAFLTSRLRAPGAARVFGGALLLDKGITESDIDRLHTIGVRTLGEIGLGSEKDLSRVVELVAYARALGWVAPLHFGGASVPGSSVIDLDAALAVKPSVISHANGGPTARPVSEVRHLIDHTDAAIEVVFAGNSRARDAIVSHLLSRDEIGRLQFGTDTPSGTGVVPLGMLRVITETVSGTALDPAIAVCAATGGTAKRYGYSDLGQIRVGHRADIAILDNPLGSESADAFAAMRQGNVPAVAGVLIDGELVVRKSSATPPPATALD